MGAVAGDFHQVAFWLSLRQNLQQQKHSFFWQIFSVTIFFHVHFFSPFSWKHSTCSGAWNIQVVFHRMFHCSNTLYVLIKVIMLVNSALSHTHTHTINRTHVVLLCPPMPLIHSLRCYCTLSPSSGQIPQNNMNASSQKKKIKISFSQKNVALDLKSYKNHRKQISHVLHPAAWFAGSEALRLGGSAVLGISGYFSWVMWGSKED